MNRKNLPTLSVIIVTRNVERTLPKALESISTQDYPKGKLEIIVVDGRSTDDTLSIIKESKLPIRVIQSDYPNDPEACRGVGLKKARGEIVAYIDADNYLPHSKWITKMVIPFLENPDIVGAETWRYGHRSKDSYLNRYFALLGSADPVGLYLGKADKISYISDKWNIYGKVLKNYKDYFIVEFDPNHFPTLGSNGFFARREMLLRGKSDPTSYFHTDVPLDLALMGHSTYAVVKDEIIHDTATSIVSFIKKRINYMYLHYQKRGKDRRYKVFDPKNPGDLFRLSLFILFSATFLQPLYISFKGYLKKRDPAWFIHPIFSFSIMVGYSLAIGRRILVDIIRKV
jgi:glycosyltransferase involved in cell wall biosynthesis